MKLALALDTGMYFESQDDIILYVLRFSCRVLSFMNFILLHEQAPLYRNRDMPVSQATLHALQEGYESVSDLLDRKFLPMLHSWTHECLSRAADLQEEARKKAESLNVEQARAQNASRAANVFKDEEQATQQAMQQARNAAMYGHGFGGGFGAQQGFGRRGQQQERKRMEKKEARNDFDAL